MGQHASTRYFNAPGGAYEHQRRYAETAAAVIQAAERERNSTQLLGRAIAAAYAEGHSVRDIARMTGLSKSRVDRLNFKQLPLVENP